MNVYTYGSLMFPEVMEALTERIFKFEDLRLYGFKRFKLKEKKYPGVIENENAFLSGRVWFDLDRQSLEILDAFEDKIYQRRTVSIETGEKGSIDTYLYVVTPDYVNLLEKSDWDFDFFRENYLDQYVEMCKGFRNKLVSG